VGYAGVPFDTYAAGETFSSGRSLSVFGGAQGGCSYQAGWFVGGIEGDVGWMDVNPSVLEPGAVNGTTVGTGGGLYGDITGRLGVAVGPVLIYAKGGWAWYTGPETFSTLAPNYASNSDVGTFNGWVAGGGFEYRFAPNWSAKVEYLHYAFGAQTFNVTAPPGIYPFTLQPTVDTIKVGVNYQFNWGAPVVTRY